MTEFQQNEGLNDRQFKNAVEEVGERHPFLVKLMIASWEFPQFIEMCREYVNDHDDCYEEKSEGKVRPNWKCIRDDLLIPLDRQIANMMTMVKKMRNRAIK